MGLQEIFCQTPTIYICPDSIGNALLMSKIPTCWHPPHVITIKTWWLHQMETFSALLAICAGNSPVPVNSPHKGQWRGALMFSLICVWINDWVNNREAVDLRPYRVHYDVILMNCPEVIVADCKGCAATQWIAYVTKQPYVNPNSKVL